MIFQGHNGLCPRSGSKDIEKNPQKQEYKAYFQIIKRDFNINTQRRNILSSKIHGYFQSI